ncbi:N5-carboxyaminoimidazole ribonucleotide synthase [bacterium HR40]|nr:N5-carboxyaminoimidazole ribonucleotide synthase [bacterium HR40]
MLPPGSTIGILGGGQLGRMTALAAARLGYRCHIFAPEEECPAAEVAAAWTRAAYDDRSALARFARSVDVVTLEFENVPREAVAFLSGFVPTRPSAEVLATTQDRLAEKELVRRLGIGVTDFLAVDTPADAEEAARALGLPFLLKTRRFGYDGKGQWRIETKEQAAAAFSALGGVPALAEAFVDYSCEISVIVARTPDGRRLSYPPVRNEHRGGILHRTVVPAELPVGTAARASEIAERLAEALAVEGLLAVEMFVTRDGRVLVNELAPRPHNSGHWTLDACATSQFEQLVRAICGLPLGSVRRFFDATMVNLIGGEVDDWPTFLDAPDARLHLYGKREVRPGRKMGHVTWLRPLGN